MYSYLLIFVTGLMSAGHCIGMCGGIISAVTLQSNLSPLRSNLLYHLGRAASYTFFGFILGIVGSFIDVASSFSGIKAVASIVGGVMLLIWVWRKFQISYFEIIAADIHARLIHVVKYFRGGPRAYVFITGIAFGFIPCGLTYAMGMQAAASAHWFSGAMTMFVFACGTLPALVLTSMVTVFASKRWRKAMHRIGMLMAALIGILSILRGLSANGVIPFVHQWLW